MATVIIELFGRHPMARVAKPPAAVSNGELSGTERFVQQERSHEPARALCTYVGTPPQCRYV